MSEDKGGEMKDGGKMIFISGFQKLWLAVFVLFVAIVIRDFRFKNYVKQNQQILKEMSSYSNNADSLLLEAIKKISE